MLPIFCGQAKKSFMKAELTPASKQSPRSKSCCALNSQSPPPTPSLYLESSVACTFRKFQNGYMPEKVKKLLARSEKAGETCLSKIFHFSTWKAQFMLYGFFKEV